MRLYQGAIDGDVTVIITYGPWNVSSIKKETKQIEKNYTFKILIAVEAHSAKRL